MPTIQIETSQDGAYAMDSRHRFVLPLKLTITVDKTLKGPS